jgi:GTP cyclohydrolase I
MKEHVNLEAAEKAIRDFLQAMGQNVDREGLKDTPKRYVKFFNEFLSPEDFNFTTFSSENYDQMIVSSGIPFFSLCEHHLAPFFGEAHIGYIPGDDKKIVGISKLPRTLEKFARKLQNQERITQQVANELMEKLNAKGVAVVIRARHLCQEMRGVKKSNVFTTTSVMLGELQTDLNARNEFLNLIKQ